ncbi:phasin family protein [Hyphomicrobium sp. DY-1]|uniref:phasin family protein n=1 Tax=Hyphomicrobium sp. DY-1 TaxID=3075650 RepID=UPI0039C34C7B
MSINSADGSESWLMAPPILTAAQTFPGVAARWSELGVSANRQYFQFLNRRIQADVEFLTSLARVRKPEEYWQAWTSYWMRATNDYQCEFAEVSKYWQTAASEGAEILSTSLERGGQKLAA